MKKVISWLRRLNDWLLRWQRKHPFLDALGFILVLIALFVLVVSLAVSLCPDWHSIVDLGDDFNLTPFEFWVGCSILYGFFVSSILVVWLRAFSYKRKEAAADA